MLTSYHLDLQIGDLVTHLFLGIVEIEAIDQNAEGFASRYAFRFRGDPKFYDASTVINPHVTGSGSSTRYKDVQGEPTQEGVTTDYIKDLTNAEIKDLFT